MREIKFRQPIFINGVFWKFHYWGFVKDGSFVGIAGEIDVAKKQSQQYAGLEDKNGKEVYEGDIVVEHFVFDVVIFRNGMFTTEKSGKTTNDCQPIFMHLKDVKIIGNKWENPTGKEKK